MPRNRRKNINHFDLCWGIFLIGGGLLRIFSIFQKTNHPVPTDANTENFRTLIESSHDCIKIFDPSGKLIYMNQAGLKEHSLTGMHDAVKWDYFSSMLPKDQKRFKQALDDAIDDKLSVFEINHTDKGSDREACMETVLPVKGTDGHVKKIICISRDITVEKHADKAKNEFISTVSHQLRTPLNSLGLTIDAFLRGYIGELSDRQKDYLSEAGKEIESMAKLITRLLNITRIESGSFSDNPEKIMPIALLDETIKKFRVIAENRKVFLRTSYQNDLSGIIFADPEILKQILRNLIDNAIRHTPIGKKVVLSAESNSHQLLISIKDDGAGIPKETQPKIFSKLYKSYDPELSGEKESSGLGLYIAKLFTEHIGGKIWFETKEGAGTTFFVALPLFNDKE